MNTHVQMAVSENELRRIYHLRYRVYIREMGKPYQNVDNEQELLSDRLDQTGTQLYLADEYGTTVGAVRSNYVQDAEADPGLSARLQISSLPEYLLPYATLCSRLVIASTFRGQETLKRIVRAIYRWSLEHNVHLNVMHTHVKLMPLFERLGFRPFGRVFVDPQAAQPQQPLYLLLRDQHHLRAVRSPLYLEWQEYQNTLRGLTPLSPALETAPLMK